MTHGMYRKVTVLVHFGTPFTAWKPKFFWAHFGGFGTITQVNNVRLS